MFAKLISYYIFLNINQNQELSTNRINYRPVVENIIHNYLLSKDYSLSVGRIGKLDCDFIARQGLENYYCLQVSIN